MTTRRCRCAHCRVLYTYYPSGVSHPLNNDTYCPECYEVIREALAQVPIKKKVTALPVTHDNPITIPVFKQKWVEWRKMAHPLALMVHRVRYRPPINFDFTDLQIDGVNYTLITNRDTGEELLEVEYQEDVLSGNLDGLWYAIRKEDQLW